MFTAYYQISPIYIIHLVNAAHIPLEYREAGADTIFLTGGSEVCGTT